MTIYILGTAQETAQSLDDKSLNRMIKDIAQALIHIHINACIDKSAFGATAYALSNQGGIIFKTDASATDITITTENYYVGITSTESPRTVTLPDTVPDEGWSCVIKDESGGAGTKNITVSDKIKS